MADDVGNINIDEAASLVQQAPQTLANVEKFEKNESLLQYQSLRLQAILQERSELRSMRIRWSNWILWCIVAIVAFDLLVVAGAGLDLLHFSNAFELPAFLAQSLINIIGLAVIIVKYLFSNWGELPKE